MTTSTSSEVSARDVTTVSLSLDSSELAEKYDTLSNLQLANGKYLVTELGIRRGQRVLDIGAGTGRLAAYVAKLVDDPALVSAIDPLPLRIALARRKLGPQAKLVVGRAEDLSAFGDSSFDYAYFNAVYHWIPDQPTALREATRVLKRGGRLGITTGDKEHENAIQSITERILQRLQYSGVLPREWLPYRVSESILRQQFEAAGLVPQLIKVRHFVDYFASAEEVLEFNASSSFGNFLSELPRDIAARVRTAIVNELETLWTTPGIPIERHTIFAMAEKP